MDSAPSLYEYLPGPLHATVPFAGRLLFVTEYSYEYQ